MRALLICAAFATFARADSLDAIFARMDEASKKFKSASARLHQVEYTGVIDEKTEEDGVLRMRRNKNGSIQMRVDFDKPNQRVVALDGHILWIYLPKGNQAERHDVSKYTSTNTVEQLLLLSFGAASSEELKKNYTVTAGGAETLDSKATTKVVLVPKSNEMRKEILQITLWVPDGDPKAIAIKEKVDKAGKNYVQYDYSDQHTNIPLSDSEVTLKLPPNVHVVGGK